LYFSSYSNFTSLSPEPRPPSLAHPVNISFLGSPPYLASKDGVLTPVRNTNPGVKKI
jgi:hypothetical protein